MVKVRKRLLRELARLVREANPPIVTYRSLTVCFRERTITIDGRKIQTQSDCIAIPLLSGDAVFVAKGDMEQIA